MSRLTIKEEFWRTLGVGERSGEGDMSLETIYNANVLRERIHGGRVHVDLEASFMLPDGPEHGCRVAQASTGEMVVSTDIEPRYGDHVVVYAPELGRFEGEVERQTEEGFAFSLSLSEARRRRLAAQLIWFANRDLCELPENRRHKRFVPRLQWTRVRLANGAEKIARINDLSISGISVDASAPVSIGDRVAFGVKAAIVGRLFDGGFVAQFEEPFAEGEIGEKTQL